MDAHGTATAKTTDELVVYGPEGGSKIVSLSAGSISLGRAATNDLSYPDDSGLSRQHFIIERVGPDFVLKDLGSKNGTELNSQRMSGSSVLHPGDRIKAGRLTIEYRKGDSKPTNQTVLFVETPQSDTSSGTGARCPQTIVRTVSAHRGSLAAGGPGVPRRPADLHRRRVGGAGIDRGKLPDQLRRAGPR